MSEFLGLSALVESGDWARAFRTDSRYWPCRAAVSVSANNALQNHFLIMVSLCFDFFVLCFGGLGSAQGLCVGSYTVEESNGNCLAVSRSLDLALFLRIADKRNLRKNRRHVGANQYDKWRLFHSTIRPGPFARRHGVLNMLCELARFIDFVSQHDLLHQVLQFMDRSLRCGVFT